MEKEDLKNIKQSIKSNGNKKSIKSRTTRFMCRWLAFFGLFSTTAVCPFCGQPGCPTGPGSAALAGGFFALLTQNWRAAISTLKNKPLSKRRKR